MSNVLSDLFIAPDYDQSKVRVTFTAPAGCTKAAWQVIDDGKVIGQGSLAPKAGRQMSFEPALPNFKPWNVDSPHLYQLRLDLTVDAKECIVTENFGMRKIHVVGDQIFVNNEKFYVRGYIRGREAHDHPNMENLPTQQWYEKNILAAKKYGFNFIRFHSRIPEKECFDAADRLGIFIHAEIRRYYGKYQKERTIMDAGEFIREEDWRAAILDTRNHPSLMVYCLGNEITHPGVDPRVLNLAKVTKELDPTRLFLDTCAHGEFDRDYVDIDVQHMSYFYPFGKNYDMYENTYNWFCFGSCKNVPLVEQDDPDNPTYKLTRSIPSNRRPVLAHEVCHYAALRNLDVLEAKFKKNGVDKPWWIDEVRKLVKVKGLDKDYPRMMQASEHFQFLSWKLGIEAARRSGILCGFHFLQLSDTDRYENSNGVVDCFDDDKGVDAPAFRQFNGDTVLLADLPRRTFHEGQKLIVPVMISHFSPTITGMADMSFRLTSDDGKAVKIQGSLKSFDLTERGRRNICRLEIVMPAVRKAHSLKLSLKLKAVDKSYTVENSWDLWVYPNRPQELKPVPCTISLDEVNLSLRYPQMKSTGSLKKPAKLLIVNRFSKEVIQHLSRGGDVMMLYRVPQTRDRQLYPKNAPRERYTLPTTWDRFKGVIWDRGTNLGAFIRPNKALKDFPNTGLMDFQFAGLIDDCDKIILDDLPANVSPIMQGVDKASRDRFDVFTFKLPELQPGWTMRKFGYIFEMKVGKGRLLVCGFNFVGLNSDRPETCAMFESLLHYVTDKDFKPKTTIAPGELEAYLLAKGRQPLLKERKMTQYWQLDEEPLESKKYWQDSEDYIRLDE